MRFVDLSQEFFEGMPQSRVLSPFAAEQFRAPSLHEPDGMVRLTSFTSGSHIGTHVDAPSHFSKSGQSICDIALESFAGSGVVLGAARAEALPISVSELRLNPELPGKDDIAIIKTGWGARFHESSAKAYVNHPYLLPEVGEWLVTLGVKMLGIDTISPDPPKKLRPPGYRMDLHRMLLDSEILIAENLNLQKIDPGRCEVFAFPLALRGSDGAPARIVARVG